MNAKDRFNNLSYLENNLDTIYSNLNDYLNELKLKKIEYDNKLALIEVRITELNNLSMLATEEDENLKYFTPILKNNNGINASANELKIEKDNLIKDKKLNEELINEIMSKIYENSNIIDILTNIRLTKEQKDDNLVSMDETFFSLDDLKASSDGLKILEAQELERKRIARDLHDSTVQNLTNLAHKTELCTKLIDLDSIRAKLELQTMINTIKTTINDMRSIIFNLRPMSLDDLGLLSTVERYINEISKNDIKVSLEKVNSEIDLLPVMNLTLFRIIQEACNNILKHSKAKHIYVKIIYNNDSIELFIVDDGVGFNTNKKVTNNLSTNFGLSMMRERVFLLSGEIEIKSEKEKGTSIHIRVPIKTSL